MTTTRDALLDAVTDLVLETRGVPSIAAVAARVGLTKQGVLHHFPSRAALDVAVLERAVARVDAVMEEAARSGSPTAAYLELSSPSREDHAAVAVVAALVADAHEVPALLAESTARWEALIARETGDPVHAAVVRLVGDGLMAESVVAGGPVAPERLEALVTWLSPARGSAR